MCYALTLTVVGWKCAMKDEALFATVLHSYWHGSVSLLHYQVLLFMCLSGPDLPKLK